MDLRYPAAGPLWLRDFGASIVRLFKGLMDAPFRLWPAATADLPAAADFTGGMVWDSTLLTFRISDGTSWLRFAAYGSGVTAFNTRVGAVTLTSGDVTTALGYPPTSVTGLTGVQSVAAFKTGLSLVKADVGLGSVDNIADAAKNVLSATKLTTARNIAGNAFDGSANISILDTDLSGAAWTAYTPTVTATAGTFTTVSKTGSYKQVGKSIHWRADITLTNIGTATGNLEVTLPTTPQSFTPFHGREDGVTGKMVQGRCLAGAAKVYISDYAGASIITNGANVIVAGTYESQ